MKSNIDLTENKDFDPKNFKVKKVVSTYSDSKGNKSRVPWDKNGKILNDHYWGYITNNGHYIDINTIQNFMSTSASWTSTSLGNPIIEYDDFGNTVSVIYHLTDNQPSVVFDDFMNYNITWSNTGTVYKTYNPYMSTTSKLFIPLTENTFSHGFRLGKVKDMKCFETMPQIYKSKYKDSTWNFKHDLRDAIKYQTYSLHHNIRDKNLAKKIFGDNSWDKLRYVYTKYESFIDICNVGQYKELSYHSKRRGEYTLTEILDDIRDKQIEYLYNHKKDMKNGSLYHLWHEEDIPKKIKWPDYYDDYLREIQGLKPRHDWRHGKDFEQTNEGFSRRQLALAREAWITAV